MTTWKDFLLNKSTPILGFDLCTGTGELSGFPENFWPAGTTSYHGAEGNNQGPTVHLARNEKKPMTYSLRVFTKGGHPERVLAGKFYDGGT